MMTIKRPKILIIPLLLLSPIVGYSEESNSPTKTVERITGSYSDDQISNIVVDMRYGLLFFNADGEQFVWRPEGQTLADRLAIVFHFVQHVKDANRIEIGRWPYRKDAPQLNRGHYRGDVLHHSIDELILVFE